MNHTIIRATFVCVCVCVCVCVFPISSEVVWRIFAKLGGCMWVDLPFALEGFFFEKVNGSTGQRVTFTFHYIIYPPASRHTAATVPFALLQSKQQSLILRLLLHWISTLYVGAPLNCPWGVLFLKGQRVDGSTGQRVKRVTSQRCM